MILKGRIIGAEANDRGVFLEVLIRPEGDTILVGPIKKMLKPVDFGSREMDVEIDVRLPDWIETHDRS